MNYNDIAYSGNFENISTFFKGEGFIPVHFSEGDTILDFDNNNKICYFVSGHARMISINLDGKLFSPLFFSAGNLFPITCIKNNFDIFPIQFSVIANTDCYVIMFTPDLLKKVILNHPEVGIECINQCHTIEHLLLYEVFGFSIKSSEKRICDLLYDFHQKSLQTGYKEYIHFSQNQLSEILGISRMQLNRVLKKLRSKGIIKTENGDIVLIKPYELKYY